MGSLENTGADSPIPSAFPMHPKPSIKRRHFLNIAIITLAAVALFWPVFFLGRTLIDVATLDNQLPWGYSAGRNSDYPYDRRDPTDMYLTRDYFVVQAYRDREVPLWNPYTMAGHPIYADGVTHTLSPSLLFYTFLDLPLGYSVARIVELVLAAVFMYAFLIGIGAGPPGALMGALVFEFSSHAMFHLTHLGWFGGLMWLPLIVLFAYRAVMRSSIANALLSGVFLAIQFYCGFGANQIYYVGAVGLFYLYFWFAMRKQLAVDRYQFGFKQTIAMIAATLLAGFGLSATQWLPVFELLKYSNRLIPASQHGYIYLPPWYAATLVFPHLFGSTYDPAAYNLYSGLNVSHDHILYLGVAALLPLGYLAYRFVGAWRDRLIAKENGEAQVSALDRSVKPASISREHATEERLLAGYFCLLTAIALVLIMAAPLYVHITQFIPILQTIRVVMRASVLFVFGASALVALGIDAMLKAPAPTLLDFAGHCRRFSSAAVSFVVLGIAGSYLVRLAGIQARGDLRGKLAFLLRAADQLSRQFAPPGPDVLVPIGLILLAALLIWLLARSVISRPLFYWSLVLLLLCDLFWNSRGLNPSFDRSRVYPHTQITDFIRQVSPGRLLVTPSDIDLNLRSDSERNKIIAPPNTLLAYGIPVVAGKDQLFPKSYKDYCALAEPQPNLSHVVFDISSSRYLDLLNVRYVLTHDDRPAPKDSRLLLTAEGLSLYENTRAFPRAFFAENVVQCGTEPEALAAVRSGALVDFSTAVVVSQKLLTASAVNPGTTGTSGTAESGSGTVSIIEDKRNSLEIATDSPEDRILVLSDNYYPGWQAYIDGTPAQIMRANLTMRAIEVPAGRHMVSFVFAPRILKIAIYVNIGAGLIVLLLLGLGLRLRGN
jgi:hypothetical protein